MDLVRLERHQHPGPPHRELRGYRVFDSAEQLVGDVENLYVDDERNLRFMDVVTAGFLGLGRQHHLVPVEAIDELDTATITLKADHGTLDGAPEFPDPKAGPDSEYQRSVREYYGYS